MSTVTIDAFTPLTVAQAEHALRGLTYHERLTGYKMTPTAGNTAVDLYSLGDAVLFVLGTKWDAPMFDPSFKGGINWVDLPRMAEWIRTVIGDAELAEVMERDVVPLPSYQAQVTALGEVFTPRMEQYRVMRDEMEAGQAPVD